MKRIIALLVAALAVTAAVASTARATTVVCIDGATTTLPASFEFDGVTKTLSEVSGTTIATDFGGIFYIGQLKADSSGAVFIVAGLAQDGLKPEDVLQPEFETHTIALGSCAQAVTQIPRTFWLCYSKFQVDPAAYSRSEAMRLYDNGKGYWVPFAVKRQVSKTNIGNGVYLVCNLPSGIGATGAAVSTGGGEAYSGGNYTRVPQENRLDYTQLAA